MALTAAQLEFLRDIAEGRDGGERFHEWLALNHSQLAAALSPGALLRLTYNPHAESVALLKQSGQSVQPSDRFEWLNVDSTSGRCRNCGATVERDRGGGARCPKGCFQLMT